MSNLPLRKNLMAFFQVPKWQQRSIDLMEIHAQALFMIAMDKQIITKYITDHVENLVSSLTLLAMNAVLTKLQMRV